jgi:hypothetical protein
MRWCRLYSEFATDPKVQIMPEPMQRRLIMLFCFQADGCLEAMDDETLGFAMHLNATELQKTKELFVKKGFLEGDSWIPRNWEKRQRVSDDGNERVKRYRERNKRVSNGAVTLQKLSQTGVCNEAGLRAPARSPAPSHSHSVSESVSEGSPEGEKSDAHSFESELGVPTGRTGKDHDDFIRAVEILKGHESTSRLASDLSMQADHPEVANFDGWRLIVAASVARRPDKTKSWNALMSYARQATLDELDKLTKKLAPGGRAGPDKPATIYPIIREGT